MGSTVNQLIICVQLTLLLMKFNIVTSSILTIYSPEKSYMLPLDLQTNYNNKEIVKVQNLKLPFSSLPISFFIANKSYNNFKKVSLKN